MAEEIPTSIVNASKTSNSYAKCRQIIIRLTADTSPINTKQNFYVSDKTGFKEKLSFQGISENAAQLITLSRRIVTLGNYEPARKK